MRTEIKNPDATVRNNQLRQLCTFQVAGRLFGVDILDVKEINAENDYTPVFHAPCEVQGYVNIRGQIHLVLDLRALLGLQAQDGAAAAGRRQLVLFKQTVGESFAVQVDAIGDIVSVDEAHYEPGQSGGAQTDGIDVGLMLGVCRLEKGLLVVLDAHRFLPVLN